MIHNMFKQLSITVAAQKGSHFSQVAHGAAVLRELLGPGAEITCEFNGHKIGVGVGDDQPAIMKAYADLTTRAPEPKP